MIAWCKICTGVFTNAMFVVHLLAHSDKTANNENDCIVPTTAAKVTPAFSLPSLQSQPKL